MRTINDSKRRTRKGLEKPLAIVQAVVAPAVQNFSDLVEETVEVIERSSKQAISEVAEPVFEILHRIDGRLRLKIAELQFDSELANRLIRSLSSFSDLTLVRVNGWSGNLIVEYKSNLVSEIDVLQRVKQTLKNLMSGEEVQLPSVRLENFPRNRTLLSRAIEIGKGIIRGALRFLEKSMPPILQLSLSAAAFAASTLQLPVLVTRGLIALSIAPIATRATRILIDEKKVSVDALDGTAAILMLTNGRLIETSFMVTLIGLGEYIRERTARQCERMVSDLLGMAGQFAWLVRGKKRICIPAEDVQVNDVVVIYPGELVPVDGIVTGGSAAIDQSKLTGEFAPVEVEAGQEVMASTVNVEGKIYVRCTASGALTKAGQVIESMKAAPIHETRVHNYAAKLADKMVVPIFLSASLCLAVTKDFVRFMSMLIFDFTTGIRISAPTAVLASMHRAGRRGILIKSGAALEKLATIDAIIFDKTGTLTSGEPKVTRVVVFNGYKEKRVLELAAAVEQRLHHPASRAIIKYTQSLGINIPERVSSEHVRGMGVRARVEDLEVLVGSRLLMDGEGIDTSRSLNEEQLAASNGESLAFIAVDGHLEGLIAYCDQLRPEAVEAIKSLKKLGVKELIMATGDHENAARRVAAAAGIGTVHASMLPDQKAELVKSLKEAGHSVAVIGDGINDSPALAHADVAISLHGGTEAARHSADVVLTDDDLRRLPESIRIARGAMQLVGQNISLAVVPNSIGLGLAAFGLTGPAAATMMNNGAAICSALNALRPIYSAGWSKTESEPKRPKSKCRTLDEREARIQPDPTN